jgi:hypothetical protein
VHDTPPFDFGSLEIDQKAQAEAGGSQIVDALRGVLVGETIHAFQFNHQYLESTEFWAVSPTWDS